MKRPLLAALLLLAASLADASVLRLSVNQMIHPISDEFIGRGLAEAEKRQDAAVMEKMEIRLLKELGYANPYIQ